MPRYALLRHDCPPDYRDGPHWDLMLERAGVDAERRLATWSLAELPSGWAAALNRDASSHPTPIATALADHRAAYLDYEGPVSGGRGAVRRWSGGSLAWREETPRRVEVVLDTPSPLAGVLRVERLGETDAWRLSWRRERC